MGGVKIGRIDRKSSLETEPRTLNFRQIDIAREAALYVVHTRSKEEAYQIFTEGMERVETMDVHIMSLKPNLWEYSEGEHDFCSCKNRASKPGTVKDVLTAPF